MLKCNTSVFDKLDLLYSDKVAKKMDSLLKEKKENKALNV